MFRQTLMVLAIIATLFSCSKDNSTEPETAEETTPTTTNTNLLDYVKSNAAYSQFYQAVAMAGMEQALKTNSPYTVFVPTNEAFETLLQQNGWNSLDDMSASTIETVVKFHISEEAAYMMGDITQGQQIPIMFNGQMVQIDKSTTPHAKIVLGLTHAFITTTDIEVSNGVIHIIDTVLIM